MQNGVMKYNGIFRKEDLEKLKYENTDYLVTDGKADIIPIPNNDVLYKMPKK